MAGKGEYLGRCKTSVPCVTFTGPAWFGPACLFVLHFVCMQARCEAHWLLLSLCHPLPRTHGAWGGTAQCEESSRGRHDLQRRPHPTLQDQTWSAHVPHTRTRMHTHARTRMYTHTHIPPTDHATVPHRCMSHRRVRPQFWDPRCGARRLSDRSREGKNTRTRWCDVGEEEPGVVLSRTFASLVCSLLQPHFGVVSIPLAMGGSRTFIPHALVLLVCPSWQPGSTDGQGEGGGIGRVCTAGR